VPTVSPIIRRAARNSNISRRRVTLTMPPDNYKLISTEAHRLGISVSEYIRIRLNCQEVLENSEQVSLDGITLSNNELNDLAEEHLEKAALPMAN